MKARIAATAFAVVMFLAGFGVAVAGPPWERVTIRTPNGELCDTMVRFGTRSTVPRYVCGP